MKKRFFGHCECPECGFPDAEVKEQKNGLAYRWCPECEAQYFPRTGDASMRLLKGIRTSTGTVTVPEPDEKPTPPVPEPDPAPVAVAPPAPVPAPAVKRGSVFDQIYG